MVSHKSKKRSKTSERVRNILMILFALAVVVIFFNLDFVQKGESIFSRSASSKLRFAGDLSKQEYSDKEFERLRLFIERYGKKVESATIETTVESAYRKLGPKTQVLYEVHVVMESGSTISTPTRRVTRGKLVDDILFKMKKDFKAYLQLEEKGKKIKSLINTS